MDIFLKLVSESFLSFYPAMVKYIKYPIKNQVWARLTIYAIISLFFIDKTVWLKLISIPGILLAVINIIHVWTSYIGFKNLESGVSYSIFYLYPILIILLSGKFNWTYFIPFLGVLFLTHSNWKKDPNFLLGFIGIIGATISEVGIYFAAKKLNNKNPWNTVLIAYLLPALFLTLFLNKDILNFTNPSSNTSPLPITNPSSNTSPLPIINPSSNKNTIINEDNKKHTILLLIGNAIIGVIGYTLRFYTIQRLPTNIYGILSYFGIVMAYIYGWLLNQDEISISKIIGSLIIVISSIFIINH
jgi:drug/metabolite transporter (DMT)-like permease